MWCLLVTVVVSTVVTCGDTLLLNYYSWTQEPKDQWPEDQEPEDQEPEDQEPEDQEPEDQEPKT